MPEPYAWKQARTVLWELGGGDTAWLPGLRRLVANSTVVI